MLKKESFLFLYGRGQGLAEVLREYLPEPVARMAVIKIRLPRFDAGETAQNKSVAPLRKAGEESFRFHGEMLTQGGKFVNRRRRGILTCARRG